MGANMQFNSYLPRYYTAANLSLDGNGSSWQLNHDSKISENTTFLSPDYHLAYNKEMLKQTMLKHETIFKDQIQELHRIYRRQRELMNDIRRGEFNSYLKSETSHSNIAFYQKASEYVQKNHQAPGFANPANCQLSVSCTEKVRTPSSLVQGNGVQDIRLSESKFKKVGKKILDLQLPADEYIDCEDRDLIAHEKKVSAGPEALSYSLNRYPQVVYANDIKSFFGSNVSSSVLNSATETPPLGLQNLNRSANPLNVAGKLKEQAAFLSNGFLRSTGHNDHLENTKPGVQFLLEESSRNTQKRPQLEVIPNLLSETGRGWEQSSHLEKTGIYRSKLNSFVQGFNAEKLPSVSKSLHKDLEQAFRPALQQGNQSLSTERKIFGGESSRVKFDSLNDKLSARHGALRESIFGDHAALTNNKKTSNSILTLNESCDSGRTPIAIQPLPCFNTSTQFGRRYKSSDGMPELAGDSDLGPHSNGLKKHTGLADNLSSSYMNFKQPGCFWELAVSEDIQTKHGKEQHESSASEPSWLKPKAVNEGKGYYGHVNLAQAESGLDDDVPKNAEKTWSSSKMTPKSFASAPHFSSCSYSSKTSQDPSKHMNSKGKCTVLDLNMACDSVPESETKLTAAGALVVAKGFGCVIDLNSSVNEAEFPQLSLTAEIGLDGPSSPENKECSPPRGESDGNQVDTGTILLGQDGTGPEDELARIAAEVIISMSSTGLETFQQETSPKKSLEWFADIASSLAIDSIGEVEIALAGTNNDDGMDFFEAMTLNLTDSKLDECCCKSDCSKDEETGTSSSPSQQRKGRARRGRQQRKDFQKEILPSLASLSRYEVTEDLQTIGGLMEAAGTHWETGPTRHAARNGCSRARKRASVSVTNAAVGSSAESLLKQLSGSDGKVGKEVICWGKVTRRRRGQRYPVRVSNQQLILSQV